MWNLILIAATFVLTLWQKIPNRIKQEIIDFAISAFAEIFRQYYQAYKSSKNNND